MARFPRLEFPGQILTARFAQLSNNLRILRCQPVLQFIQSLDRRKHVHRNFDSVLGHAISVLVQNRKANAVAVLSRRRINSELSTVNSPQLLNHFLKLRT